MELSAEEDEDTGQEQREKTPTVKSRLCEEHMLLDGVPSRKRWVSGRQEASRKLGQHHPGENGNSSARYGTP